MTMKSADDIRAALTANAAALHAALADAALYDRIKRAQSEATRLQTESQQLTKALSEALDREGKEARAAIAATIRNLRITSSGGENGPLKATMLIEWESLQYNSRYNQNEWAPQTCNSFRNLPQHVLNHILASDPSNVPAVILDLAPGDPEKAMDRYFVAVRRGYL